MTPSAYLWLPALMAIGLWRRSLFLPLLLLAGVFQATSLLNVEFGSKLVPLTPYYFLLIVLTLLGGWRLAMGARVRLGGQGLQLAVVFFSLFVFVSSLSILVGPGLFTGLPVYLPDGGIDAQFHNMGRLLFSVSMVGQLLYLMLNFAAILTLSFLWQSSFSSNQVIRLIAFATLLVFGISIWQVLHNQTGLWFPSQFLYTAKGWSLGNDQVLGSYSRINATFTEPSTLSVFMAGIMGFWIRILVGKFSWSVLLLSLAVILVLMLTSSATAYLCILILAAVVLYSYVLLPVIGRLALSRGSLFLILGACLALGGILVLYSTDSAFSRFVDVALLDKTASDSFLHRAAADERAFGILQDTYGLGVGLGGNRPSSFVTSLLSNVGIVGFVSFLGFLLSLTGRWLVRKPFSERDEKFSLVFNASSWALWMTLLGMAISVPDLSFPPLWIWVFVLILLSVEGGKGLQECH